jgi:hypothetical protein
MHCNLQRLVASSEMRNGATNRVLGDDIERFVWEVFRFVQLIGAHCQSSEDSLRLLCAVTVNFRCVHVRKALFVQVSTHHQRWTDLFRDIFPKQDSLSTFHVEDIQR